MGGCQLAAAQATRGWADAIQGVSPGAGEWVIISDENWPELAQLRVVWKAWFFFVRALCDNVYRLLLANSESQPASVAGSMEAAARKTTNPVAQILAVEAPEFLNWFRTQRERRNAIKNGVALTCTALHSPGVAITFDEYRLDPETGLLSRIVASDQHRVTLADVVSDVAQLRTVLLIIRERYEPESGAALIY